MAWRTKPTVSETLDVGIAVRQQMQKLLFLVSRMGIDDPSEICTNPNNVYMRVSWPEQSTGYSLRWVVDSRGRRSYERLSTQAHLTVRAFEGPRRQWRYLATVSREIRAGHLIGTKADSLTVLPLPPIQDRRGFRTIDPDIMQQLADALAKATAPPDWAEWPGPQEA